METTDGLRSLSLMLTARCNLTCAYCYQNARNGLSMSWSVARAALDHLLASPQPIVEVSFTGGEPLLEWSLLRRAVAYAIRRRPLSSIRFHVATNGLGLMPAIVDFLAGHRFDLQISHDGIAEVQALRSPDSGAVLDRHLAAARRRHPAWFHQHVSLSATVVPATIPQLAASCAHLLATGVQRFALAPASTPVPGWHPALVPELTRQFDRIRQLCLAHLERTEEIPLLLFRDREAGADSGPDDGALCGALRRDGFTIDVDGRAYGCGALTRSVRTVQDPRLRACQDELSPGNVCDPDFLERCRRYPDLQQADALFQHRERKFSTYRRCRDCPHVASCHVCPLAIGCREGDPDPDRVPDFICAFRFAALSARAGFLAAAGIRRADQDSPLFDERLRPWRELGRALRRDGASEPGGRIDSRARG